MIAGKLVFTAVVLDKPRVTPCRRFLCRNIEQYLVSHMALIPKTAILVAVLYQHGACQPRNLRSAESSTRDMELPTSDGHEREPDFTSHHKHGVVVGTLELSFTTSTRTHFMTLNAPPVSC